MQAKVGFKNGNLNKMKQLLEPGIDRIDADKPGCDLEIQHAIKDQE